MMKVDLHLHTEFSDGTDSPKELLEKIRACGIDFFSITDHDAIAGCEALAGNRSGHAGNEENGTHSGYSAEARLICGVEFSCEDDLGKYHILGYGYRLDGTGIRSLVAKAHRLRLQKMNGRVEFLRDEFGFVFPKEEIDELFAWTNPGKPHLANLMVSHGYAPDRDIAIQNYINRFDDTVYGVIGPGEAIDAILEDDGIPVLAHAPFGDGAQNLGEEELRRRLTLFSSRGLKGVEGYYSGYDLFRQKQMLALAKEYGLLVTAGSDYHGNNKTVAIGQTGLDNPSDTDPLLYEFLSQVRTVSMG